MEEQYSCDEDEWVEQEATASLPILPSRCSPAHGGARWSQPGGQVSEHSDSFADQSEEVDSRVSGMTTGSRNSKNSKAEHGSYLHLSGDEDDTEAGPETGGEDG